MLNYEPDSETQSLIPENVTISFEPSSGRFQEVTSKARSICYEKKDFFNPYMYNSAIPVYRAGVPNN
jgi:hypothetical protein